jgi:hypothetical protein
MNELISASEPARFTESHRGPRASTRLGRIGVWSLELRFGGSCLRLNLVSEAQPRV